MKTNFIYRIILSFYQKVIQQKNRIIHLQKKNMITGNNLQIQRENVFGGLRQGQESRQGDWICVQCNNLNFSFRKRCNRCKVQSREENEEQIRQAYMYYEQYCRNMSATEAQQPQTLTPRSYSSMSITISSSKQNSSTLSDFSLAYDLPSVSPYIRRYKSPKSSSHTKTQISQGWSSDDQSNQSKQQYLSQYCWQNILVESNEQQISVDQQGEGMDDCLNEQQENYYEGEIYKLFQNIVL